jgi:hypothetical protein
MFDKILFEKVFSKQRINRFFTTYLSDNKAIIGYQCNIELSEVFYPCIAVFEIALRNAIHRELTALFGREDWYVMFAETLGLSALNKDISRAMRHISERGERLYSAKIVAELTLGFWVKLFNVEYERILWKNLRKVFCNMPKSDRKRKNVAANLNHIRNFRKRVFHHEPICWDLLQLETIHNEMLTTISWINKDITVWINTFDRFESVFDSTKKRLE